MSFLDNVKTKYETPGSSLGADFIRPALAECVLYRRETGWFRSSAIRVWAGSIINVIENDNVKIEIIAYPEIDQTLYRSLQDTLSQEEKDQKLREHREKILLKALTVQSNSENHTKEVGKYIGELLSYLIATKKLEIKFVTLVNEEDWKIVDDDSEGELTHIKRGYFEFPCGTYVSFTGSANESLGGLMKQGEAFYVFDSRHNGYKLPAQEIKDDVDVTWNENKVGYRTHKISKKLLKEIKKIAPRNKPKKPDNLIPEPTPTHEPIPTPEPIPSPTSEPNLVTEVIKLRNHQKDVINSWIKNSYRGIVQHATGSGKTITGIYAMKHYFEEKGGSNAIVIVPSKILQEQWLKEIVKHIPDAIIHQVGGLQGKSKQWENKINLFTSPHKEAKSQIIIGVKNSISKKNFYSDISTTGNLMILADEVHTLGANESKKFLDNTKSNYRMGLSATVERANDFDGTTRIFDYFEKKLLPEYGLKEALEDKPPSLCQYQYEIKKIFMTQEETDIWIEHSTKIRREFAKFKNNDKQITIPNSLKMLLIERAKIAKKAKNKLNATLSIIKNEFRDNGEQRWLIYCQDLEQMEELRALLIKNGYKSSVYYSDMKPEEKTNALDIFKTQGGLLLSIKCLDEGVDLPGATHALILASSSNKREYIQRRGRVLRLDPNNPYKIAKIFDLITLSLDIDDQSIKSLIATEVTRAYEFADYSLNSSSAKNNLESIFEEYDISTEDKLNCKDNDYEDE